MGGLFSTLVGRGIRRGLVGGNRGWQVALAVGLVGRLFRALGGRPPRLTAPGWRWAKVSKFDTSTKGVRTGDR